MKIRVENLTMKYGTDILCLAGITFDIGCSYFNTFCTTQRIV